MQDLGALSLVGDAAQQLTSRLPWGWYAALALLDLALVGLVVRQRRHRRVRRTPDVGSWRPAPVRAIFQASQPEPEPAEDQIELTGRVLRHGWWIPASRASAAPESPAEYQWPVHTEIMRSRLG